MSEHTDRVIDSIRTAITDRRCVPIVGAGASIGAGGPNWEEYLGKMAEGLGYDVSKLGDLPPEDRASFLRAERTRMGLPSVRIHLRGPSRAHQILAAWGNRLYVTTNYDDGLEHALKDSDAEFLHNDKLKTLDLQALKKRTVVKLCSSSRDEDASTHEDFAYLTHNSAALDLLITLLRCYTVVFVGCSMRDPLIWHALNHAYASQMGFAKHYALLPADFPAEFRQVLRTFHVQSALFPCDDKTRGLVDILTRCSPKPPPAGLHRLIVFEPGAVAKTRQLLSAFREGNDLDVSRVLVLTEKHDVAEEVPKLATSTHVDVLRLPNLGDVDEVMKEVRKHSLSWTDIVAPYEYAVLNAALFAEKWRDAVSALRFHSPSAARLSRDKRNFRAFVQGLSDDILAPIPHKVLPVGEIDLRSLRKKINDVSKVLQSDELVIKPPDAAGSIGVRSLDVKDNAGTQSTLRDLINILDSMPVTDETARCEISELIVEQRVHAEEFSVETRNIAGRPEALAIHWKVDIDGDKTRFFERLFVTLSSSIPVHEKLAQANERLIKSMKVDDGVLHAEYRADPDGDRIYPLEVGLRPGGGMISASVGASRGIDLFEAAVRCAIRLAPQPVQRERTVSTGLIFSKRPGVLAPLSVEGKKGRLDIDHGDIASLKQWLVRELAQIDRSKARDALNEVVSRNNTLCKAVREAFDPAANNGVGLRVELRSIELWESPGSIVVEEEASYIGGLLIASDPALPPIEATAEAVAAMQICLKAIVCETGERLAAIRWRSTRVRSYPDNWNKMSDGGFRSNIDSWTFAKAIEQCTEGQKSSILDLGCGSARPAAKSVSGGCQYLGVDIDAGVLGAARGNLATIRSEGWKVIEGDVERDDWLLHDGDRQWDIVAANLPYLPTRSGSASAEEARFVDGGENGLRFIPDRVLQIAERVKASSVIINASSLCDYREFGRRLAKRGFGVCKIVATLAPLEEYALRRLDHLQGMGVDHRFGSSPHWRQIIFSLELKPSQGIPFEMAMEQAIARLKPEVNEFGTLAIGISSW